MAIPLNTADASLIRIRLALYTEGDGELATGVTVTGAELQTSKNTGPPVWVNAAGTLQEIGNGAYYYQGVLSDATTEGFLGVKVEKAGIRTQSVWTQVIGPGGFSAMTFSIFDEDGLLDPGVDLSSPAGTTMMSLNGAAFVTPTGTYGEIGGGVYYYIHDVQFITGFVLIKVEKAGIRTALAWVDPDVLTGVPGGGGSLGPPIITIITDLTAVGRYTPVVFTVVGQGANLRRCWANASFSSHVLDEMIHDGNRFGTSYTGVTNVRANITNGYQFTILRDGGWPGIPVLDIEAVDTFGAGT